MDKAKGLAALAVSARQGVAVPDGDPASLAVRI
jgi:hypothetical protein